MAIVDFFAIKKGPPEGPNIGRSAPLRGKGGKPRKGLFDCHG